ncbi:MAG TPA: hypothetical protein VMD05_00310 [Candidatus Nanoarchaeia archaeon]|nr:hypothetical protein [Candidatus Nanoarchaeia archaeon]
MSKKAFMAAIIISVFLVSLVAGTHFCLAQSGTEANDKISQDTTWTKAGSPYIITGTVVVNDGVTLTIEPGATVNMNRGDSLQVNGTLVARGTSSEKIVINGGDIIFTQYSNDWNNQTGSGSIIENSTLNSTSILVSDSPEIFNNIIVGGANTLQIFGAINIAGGTPLIANNTIYGAGYTPAIEICGGSPMVLNNTLVGGINGNSSARFPIISNNNIKGEVIVSGGSPVISNNLITGLIRKVYLVNNESFPVNGSTPIDSVSFGIGLTGYNFGDDKLYNAIVTDNTIVGCSTGLCWNAGGGALIERNLIVNNTGDGLSIGSNAVIENNTIDNNSVGMRIYNFNGYDAGPSGNFFPPTILNNNIQNNSQYNVYSYCDSDLNATYNWWGSTEQQSIQKTIYDKSFDSTLGTISSIPCQSAPNDQAYPNSSNASLTLLSTLSTNEVYFALDSNSTISALFFNETSSDINFTVSGLSGTTGYVRVGIAQNFMPNEDDIKVFIDGNPINYTLSSSGDLWIILFTYHHSTHQISISQTENTNESPSPSSAAQPRSTPSTSPSPSIPELPSFLFIPFLASVMLAGTIIYRRKLRHKNDQMTLP